MRFVRMILTEFCMAAAQLMLPANRAFNSNGLAVRGAVAYLYTTGTTTPQPFYSDSGMSVSLGSSITANGAGRFPTAYQDTATPFRLRIEDADGAELEDIDPFYFGQTAVTVNSTARTPQMYGAEADATSAGVGTDDRTAIQSALDAEAAGDTVYNPVGNYKVASSIDLDSENNVKIEGPAGGGAGYSAPPPAQYIFTGTGSGRFISAQNTNAITIREMGIRYSSGSYTGDLVAPNNTNNGVDAAYASIHRNLIGGVNVATARSLVSLEGSILSSVDENHLHWGQVGIRGAKYVGAGNVLYSNAHYIARNTFDNLTTAAITNAGQGWGVICNWFEGTNGGSGGMPKAYTADIPAIEAPSTAALCYLNNWHGDAVNVTTSWWDNGNTTMRGLLMAANFFDNGAVVPSVKFTAAVNGAAIIANSMSSTIDLNSVDHLGLFIAGNFLVADPTNLSPNSDDIFIVANRKDGGYASNVIRLHSVGEFRIGYPGATTTGNWDFYAGTATEAALRIHGDAGTYRTVKFLAGNTERLRYGVDSSNQGAEICYDGSGGFVGYTRTINLATLAQTFGGAISATNLSGTNTGDQFGSTAASKLIGRGSASGAGAAQEITLGTGLSMSGTTLSATGSGALIGRQVITATGAGTYTPTAGTNSIIVEVQGAGGGGGGAATTTATNAALGKGGGGGGWASKRYTSGFSGASYSVGAKGTGGAAGNNAGTAGGDTTFTVSGTALTGGGGGGGAGGASTSATGIAISTTAGGTASNGDINIEGGASTIGIGVNSSSVMRAAGGSSQMSRGAGAVGFATSAGNNAAGYGGGGSGGGTSAGSAVAGGNGSDGIIIIWEYA